jgi:multisubunit Na+/H+ antiporter MnhG subunit
VAAIGLAALLFQLRLRKDIDTRIHAPLWLNVLGLIFAVGAVIADFSHLKASFMLVAALAAVVCFAFSGVSVIRSVRKR